MWHKWRYIVYLYIFFIFINTVKTIYLLFFLFLWLKDLNENVHFVMTFLKNIFTLYNNNHWDWVVGLYDYIIQLAGSRRKRRLMEGPGSLGARGGDQGKGATPPTQLGRTSEHPSARRTHRRRWRWVYTLLFLPPVTKPDTDDFFLHCEAVCKKGYFLGRWLWILHKCLFQSNPDWGFNWCPLFPSPSYCFWCRHRIAQRIRVVEWVISIQQPLLQKRFQFAHVLKWQIQSFKPRNGSLREVISIKLSHCKTNVPLSET